MKIQRVKLELESNILESKLLAVKLLKEFTGLGLKESKFLIDDMIGFDTKIKTPIYVDVSRETDKNYWKSEFNRIGINIFFDERERKMKRLLYSDIETLTTDMLSDMGNWENYVDKSDLENLSYNKCKDIAISKIIDKYREFFNQEFFMKINEDISRINQLESKNIGAKFIKFNEEFGEFNAEYLKYLGHTYKQYDREELLGEMADTLQVLLSLYDHIGSETGITMKEILSKISEKNIKWEEKIKDYMSNGDIDDDIPF